MMLYLNGKKITIFPILLKEIGSGLQGKVYKYKGRALKIPYSHKNIFDKNFDISILDCKYLKNINTKRILLPKDYLIDKKGNLCAYTLTLININDKEKLYSISKDKFINELYALKEEIKLLSENCVTINDIKMKNFMYDGMFRFVDCGRYSISYQNIGNLKTIKNIENINNNHLQNFVINILILRNMNLNKSKDIKAEIQKFGCVFIGEYIEKTMDKHETLLEYTKRKSA